MDPLKLVSLEQIEDNVCRTATAARIVVPDAGCNSIDWILFAGRDICWAELQPILIPTYNWGKERDSNQHKDNHSTCNIQSQTVLQAINIKTFGTA